jgi:hypothetical protein
VQSILDAMSGLVWSAVSMLVVPTILLLLFKKFVPVLGDALWRGYCRLLVWLVVAPVRLIRLLIREATGRRRT